MKKIIDSLLTVFMYLAGMTSGAYAGLSWSALLARNSHSEEDVTYDWYLWVLGGAVAGLFAVFICASVIRYLRHSQTA